MKKITEERILQISNDISEDMCRASKKELIEVVRFWQNQTDKWINGFNELQGLTTNVLLESNKLRNRLNK